jgi:hypothetical protein
MLTLRVRTGKFAYQSPQNSHAKQASTGGDNQLASGAVLRVVEQGAREITMRNLKQLLELAQEYRESWNLPGHGVIVFHDGAPQGWVNELRNPESWCPGCIALTRSGSAYRSEGGTEATGALSWQPVAAL